MWRPTCEWLQQLDRIADTSECARISKGLHTSDKLNDAVTHRPQIQTNRMVQCGHTSAPTCSRQAAAALAAQHGCCMRQPLTVQHVQWSVDHHALCGSQTAKGGGLLLLAWLHAACLQQATTHACMLHHQQCDMHLALTHDGAGHAVMPIPDKM